MFFSDNVEDGNTEPIGWQCHIKLLLLYETKVLEESEGYCLQSHSGVVPMTLFSIRVVTFARPKMERWSLLG